VEVKETNTGSLTFGAAVTSDAGLLGQISLKQRNFDITDFPDSWGELFSSRAFRGGGQTFDITLAPGTETQNYSISLADPYIFDTDYAASGAGYYFVRQYTEYDEHRLGTSFAVERRFGERWTASVSARVVDVRLKSIDAGAPVDVFESAGPDLLTGVRLGLQRFTSDSRTRPSNGTKFDIGVEQVGALGGDLDFTKIESAYAVYLPLYESFLGHKTVLSLNTRVQYIPQNHEQVPVYERYYLGGRSFRGFDFRTVSPKGIRNDTMMLGNDPVGGTWSFFAGTEVEQPLWQDILSGVVFIDSGTVINKPGFDDYRLSAGFGVRIRIPALGPLPLAFDFGFPILKQFGDKERVFSFSIDIPFGR
jgi:outer membrane protein insertion porin family